MEIYVNKILIEKHNLNIPLSKEEKEVMELLKKVKFFPREMEDLILIKMSGGGEIRGKDALEVLQLFR